jgi:hypothetical protein
MRLWKQRVSMRRMRVVRMQQHDPADDPAGVLLKPRQNVGPRELLLELQALQVMQVMQVLDALSYYLQLLHYLQLSCCWSCRRCR